MQQYPNYYPNQMASQFQPNFNQQMQNPYMDRIAQLQNFQMQNQRPVATINGRFVQSAEEVNASDVAMDGSMSLFPKADMTEIYGKAWQPDGTIKTVVFRPVLEEQSTNSQENIQNVENGAFFEFKEQITEMLNGINARFDDLEKTLKPKTTKTKVE